MKRFKIYSGLKTPDGTILHSKYQHDCVMHKDKNGKWYLEREINNLKNK